MSGVDDLFSSERPPAPVRDRLDRAAQLLAVALPLNVLGVTCFTGVPGAVLALLAWHIADEEVLRVESGALPAERGVRARRVRGLGFAMLVFAIGSLILQIVLFGAGFYQALLTAAAGLFGVEVAE